MGPDCDAPVPVPTYVKEVWSGLPDIYRFSEHGGGLGKGVEWA